MNKCVGKCVYVCLPTFLHAFVQGQLGHDLVQQVGQSLCVGQQLLVGGGKLLILLVPVLTQLPLRVQDPPGEERRGDEEKQKSEREWERNRKDCKVKKRK